MEKADSSLEFRVYIHRRLIRLTLNSRLKSSFSRDAAIKKKSVNFITLSLESSPLELTRSFWSRAAEAKAIDGPKGT